MASISELANKRVFESNDPTPFEAVILGTLLVVENPKTYFDFLKIRVKPQMFSENNQPVAQLLFDMLEIGEPLRNYRVIELATQKGLSLTKDDITNFRYQHAETDFEELCVSFVDKWYESALTKSALQFNNDINDGIRPTDARRELNLRDEEIENLKLGAKDVDYSIYNAAAEAVADIEKRKGDKNFITGQQTGIYKLDRMLGGLEGGELYFFVGSAGEGKTTLALQCLANVALTNPVDVFSLEMSKKQLAPKILSAQTGISTINMKLGKVTDTDIDALKGSLTAISNLQMSIIDDVHHIDEIERTITLRAKKHGIKAVAIDNLTTIKHSFRGSRDDNEIAITYQLKHLAVKLNIPIVLLVHKNKDNTSRADKRPVTTDIKFAGGAVAADVVVYPYTPPIDMDWENYTEIVITKNRSTGLEGYIPMVFANEWNLYCEADEEGRPVLPNQKRVPTPSVQPVQNIITGIRGNPDLLDNPIGEEVKKESDIPF